MITLRQVDAFRAVMITGTITGAVVGGALLLIRKRRSNNDDNRVVLDHIQMNSQEIYLFLKKSLNFLKFL